MCEKMEIDYIDLNGWYCDQKAKQGRRFFGKQGIHWTLYGVGYAADTFNHYLGNLIGKKIPPISIRKTECGLPPRSADDDIGKGLNLIWPVSIERFCYNELDFDEDITRTQTLSVIFITDSFFWIFLYQGIPQHCYKRLQSSFYFNETLISSSPEADAVRKDISSLDWMTGIKQADAVALLSTESNLSSFGMGFIDKVYEKFHGR